MLYELALPSSPATHQQIQQHNNITSHHQNTSLNTSSNSRISSVQQKDYSRPLHVDCSVEYELPSQVKPPPSTNGKIDPLLMIHPCYFRKIEAQRRSPFVNNLPGRGGASSSAVASTATPSTPTTSQTSTTSNSHNSTRSNRILVQQNTNLLRNTSNTNNLMYSQQQQQQTTVPQHYHHHPHQIHPQTISNTTSNSRQQQQWNNNLELHQFNKPTTIPSTVGATKHLSSCAGGAAVSNIVTGMYNNTSALDGGGLWNTNLSPLAAERFPEPQVTLLHQLQHQPTDQQSTISHHHQTPSNIGSSSCKQSKHVISGKYRQYHLPTHRLHPYMSVAALAMGPQLAQMQQISCYNV